MTFLGAGHEKQSHEDWYTPLTSYTQSYVPDNTRYCTIMHVKTPYNCIFLPYFSSPKVIYDGEHLGAKYFNDNALWIKQNR